MANSRTDQSPASPPWVYTSQEADRHTHINYWSRRGTGQEIVGDKPEDTQEREGDLSSSHPQKYIYNMTNGGVIILHQPIVERGSIINLQSSSPEKRNTKGPSSARYLSFWFLWQFGGFFFIWPTLIILLFFIFIPPIPKGIGNNKRDSRNSSGTNVSLQNSQIVCLTLFHIYSFIYFYGSAEI